MSQDQSKNHEKVHTKGLLPVLYSNTLRLFFGLHFHCELFFSYFLYNLRESKQPNGCFSLQWTKYITASQRVDVTPPPFSSLLNSLPPTPLSSLISPSVLSLSYLPLSSFSTLSQLSQLSQLSSAHLKALSLVPPSALFLFFRKENIALFLTFYKGRHVPIHDLLLFTKENREGWGWTTH